MARLLQTRLPDWAPVRQVPLLQLSPRAPVSASPPVVACLSDWVVLQLVSVDRHLLEALEDSRRLDLLAVEDPRVGLVSCYHCGTESVRILTFSL
jgi:hypothetical protein